MRAGAGAVVLGTPKSVYPVLAKKLTEVMVHPLEDTEAGSLGLRAIPEIMKYVKWADVVVLGPGLSLHPETQALAKRLLVECNRPLLVDADGLNALAASRKVSSLLRKRKRGTTLLTPHTGELSRLIGVDSLDIEGDRVGVAQRIARNWGVTIVLKGAPSVTASDEGISYVNSTGNPGMATAGSGDVLAGIIATLWAQAMRCHEAAYCGVYLHGLAGDLACSVRGERSLVAGDLIAHLPAAFRRLSREGSPN
jgi:NAD(P)H-hydrate epimerase